MIKPGITLITGTDTDVGKTVATAALTAFLLRNGRDVAVCKPAQTGLPEGVPGDLAQVVLLSGLDAASAHEFVRLPEPLAPTTAARRAGVRLPSIADVAARLADLASRHTYLLVEGAGGLLVGLDAEGAGLLELAAALDLLGWHPHFVVVARAGLGTLNHTALTCNAIRAAGNAVDGLIIGAFPSDPDLAERCNADELAVVVGAPVMAAIPDGLGDQPEALQRYASTAFERSSCQM